MGSCTWADCGKPATAPQKDKDGAIWADLCAEHDAELTLGLESGDAKAILRGWVRAQGGAKKATQRLLG